MLGCCACLHPSKFVRAITCTFMRGFENNLAQLFFLRGRRAVLNICLGRLKIKVTLDGQKMKLT